MATNAERIDESEVIEDTVVLENANNPDEEDLDVQLELEDIPIDTATIVYSDFDIKDPDERNTNKSFVELVIEKVKVKKNCDFNSGEITVCADPNKNEKYRVYTRRSLRELPRSHRSWGALSESLIDNGLVSTRANSHSSFVEESLIAARESCDVGLEDARKQTVQAREIAKIAIKQTGSKPRRVKGPCEF